MHFSRSLIKLLVALPLAACAGNADGTQSSSNNLNGGPEAVPQAQLIKCVDGDKTAVLTTTDDMDITYDVLGQHGTSLVVGAGFTWEGTDVNAPTHFNIELANGKQIVVDGFFEDQHLLQIKTSEGTFTCGEGSTEQAYNIRVMIDATNASFKKRKLFAVANFGSGEPEEIIVRPALRGLGAIFEGRAPQTGAWFLFAKSYEGNEFLGQGASGGEHAAGTVANIMTFSQIGAKDALTSDAKPERAFPSNTATYPGMDYAKLLVDQGAPNDEAPTN